MDLRTFRRQQQQRNDLIGIAASVGVHALLVVGLSLLTMAASDPMPLGYIEVDFGPMSEGRPVARSTVSQPEQAPREAEESSPVESTPPPVPEAARPVRLPQAAVTDPDRVTQPDAETVAPQSRPDTRSTEDVRRPEESRPVRPLGSGDPDGDDRQQDGQDGTGNSETRSAPFQIEGLNRIPVQTVTPQYTEQVNAEIGVRITVDPAGRIVGRMPLRKADARLEDAVMRALAGWRFNPLPPNAPQTNQVGVIYFRFRLQ